MLGSTRLTLVRLHATISGNGWTSMPFDDVPGFNDYWWHRTITGDPEQWFTFRDLRGEEVVRAAVDLHADVARNYNGVVVPAQGFADVSFFEVRDDSRRQDLGTEAIGLLSEYYQGEQLAAFSEEADHFWISLGWTPHRPLLGPEDYEGHYQTFFVAPAPDLS